MLQSGRFHTDEIEVTNATGTRDGDGFQKTGEETVLLSKGSLQQEGRLFRERTAYYETGDGLFFASKDIHSVSIGNSVTIDTEDGRTLNGTVEEKNVSDGSLLISFD